MVSRLAPREVPKQGLNGPGAIRTWRAFRHEARILRKVQGHPDRHPAIMQCPPPPHLRKRE
jgi:hypothetical protein